MKTQLIAIFLGLTCAGWAQSPEDAMLPTKFDSISEGLQLVHFPDPVLASQDSDRPDIFLWKHNSTIFSPTQNVEIIEGGAYIFYNNQWNLRVRYDKSEFASLFQVPEAVMKAGQPYTFIDNWRTDTRLFGGWAMWYVIGLRSDGETVYGVGKLETVGALYE